MSWQGYQNHFGLNKVNKLMNLRVLISDSVIRLLLAVPMNIFFTFG